MKFVHLSDLHLGKRVHEASMVEEQRYILEKITDIIGEEKPDAVVISGDIYDKVVPTEEAVKLFDEFLFKLSGMNTQTMIISGNHDSADRLSYANRLIAKSGIHIAGVYNGNVVPITLKDGFGDVNFYLLPFVKAFTVKHCFPDEEENIRTTGDAVRVAINRMNIDTAKRNILVAHQFVTGADRCDSEEISIGGADNIDAEVFECFDYVALGHIHGPQNVKGSEKIRYCGTPLKYSFSEVRHEKSVSVVEMCKKGELKVRTVPLVPLHDMKEIKGTYEYFMNNQNKDYNTVKDDFLHIILTDEDEILNAKRYLTEKYCNLLLLDYDNTRTRNYQTITTDDAVSTKTPLELFGELYEKQNGTSMNEDQTKYMEKLIKDIWEAGV
ncbi:MAG: exonuclease SbcCD subunit D [Sphaerochaetaceae bacterium]|nr:exonuclease SbcCD subunit D [Sphaerochaetaceae bacterium]